jgi:hypothetical protein
MVYACIAHAPAFCCCCRRPVAAAVPCQLAVAQLEGTASQCTGGVQSSVVSEAGMVLLLYTCINMNAWLGMFY